MEHLNELTYLIGRKFVCNIGSAELTGEHLLRVVFRVRERLCNALHAECKNEYRDTDTAYRADSDGNGYDHTELGIRFTSVRTCPVCTDDIAVVVLHRLVRNVVVSVNDVVLAEIFAVFFENGFLNILVEVGAGSALTVVTLEGRGIADIPVPYRRVAVGYLHDFIEPVVRFHVHTETEHEFLTVLIHHIAGIHRDKFVVASCDASYGLAGTDGSVAE